MHPTYVLPRNCAGSPEAFGPLCGPDVNVEPVVAPRNGQEMLATSLALCRDIKGRALGWSGLRVYCDVQSDRTHQRQRVAVRDRPWLHPVVEVHLSVFQFVFEVDVFRTRRQFTGDADERHVVSRDHPDRAETHETAQHAGGADQAVV